jgi:hypothetical protein
MKREAFVAVHEKHAAKGLAVVGVVGDGTGRELHRLAAFVALARPPFPVAIAGGLAADWKAGELLDRARFRAAAAYDAEGYPHGVLLDRRGVVRGRWFPGHKRSDALLERLLAE